MGDLAPPLHVPGEVQHGDLIENCPEDCVLAQILCKGLRELGFPLCPRYSTRVEPVDEVHRSSVDIPARGHIGGWSHEAFAGTPEGAKKKVAFAAITDLCGELPEEIAHTSLRYIPWADPQDALWLARLNNIPNEPPNHEALLTVTQFASEAASLYREELFIAVEAREDRFVAQDESHDLRLQVDGLEAQLAQANEQIEDLEVQVQHLNAQIIPLGPDEPVVLHVGTHMGDAPVASDGKE